MHGLPISAKNKNIVVIGGGTGSFTMLQALKELSPNVTALVNMVDDGGSTGMLRDELGVLPPGDVRQCLVALSRSEKMRDLFNYRFEEGSLEGHSFGNLFLTALEKQTGSFAAAVKTAGEVLNIQGRVVPVTLDNIRLVYQDEAGQQTYGQHAIDSMRFKQTDIKAHIYLDPPGMINPDAEAALREADYIIIAPGDVYTSIGPLLVVEGVGEALRLSRAKIMYVCNLVVKPGQTTGFDVCDHAAEIERLAGAPILDVVFYNTAVPESDLLEKYAKDEEFLVPYDIQKLRKAHYHSIGGSFISSTAGTQLAHDPLVHHRSLIRHDITAIKRAIDQIVHPHTILTKYK